jgi:type II secretory pathway pseudopilin PulG
VIFIQKIYQSQMFIEYQQNKRLQWMLVLIVTILALSLLKQLSDNRQQQRIQAQSQIELLARLKQSAQNNIDANIVESIKTAYFSWIDLLPKAASSSVAEAQALTEIDKNLGKLLKRKRLNLLGSEQLTDNNQVIWQVRVEISGQLAELDLIELLQHFDNQHKHARITSFQYSPKTSNSISLVVDLIYKRAENA